MSSIKLTVFITYFSKVLLNVTFLGPPRSPERSHKAEKPVITYNNKSCGTFARRLHSIVTTPTAVPFALHVLMTLISNTSDSAVLIMTLLGPKGVTPAFSLCQAVNFESDGASNT